jgi:hypothetical protein
MEKALRAGVSPKRELAIFESSSVESLLSDIPAGERRGGMGAVVLNIV